jgi:uncharacterized membrane protein YjjB (DUF3815 family)
MMVVDILLDGLLAAVAGIGFGAISRPPKRAFLYIAILAAIGHGLRFYLMERVHLDIATASFFASLVIGAFSMWFGRLTYCPITVLYIPALLPMVPGMYAYKSVLALIKFMRHQKETELAGQYMQEMFSNAVVTVSTVFLLALGATLFIFFFPKRAYSMTRRPL